MERVVHFKIQADSIQRALRFYKDVFGWRSEKHRGDRSWLILTDDGQVSGFNGLISAREKTYGSDKTATYIYTVGKLSFYQVLSAIVKNGGQILSPRKEIPGVGWLAYCKDTEGNTFGIIQKSENS